MDPSSPHAPGNIFFVSPPLFSHCFLSFSVSHWILCPPLSVALTLCVFLTLRSGVLQGYGAGAGRSPVVHPAELPLSWGRDDRKSARWHRAGLQHVTSSLERQDGRRRGGWRVRKGGAGGGARLKKGGEEMWSRVAGRASHISVLVFAPRVISAAFEGVIYRKSITFSCE